MQFVSTDNIGDSCADPSLDSPEPAHVKVRDLQCPNLPRTIYCHGTHNLNPRPKEVRFSRKVIWAALFGKKKVLPVNNLSDWKCPYRDVEEDWQNDQNTVDLGPDFAPFFSSLLEVELSLS